MHLPITPCQGRRKRKNVLLILIIFFMVISTVFQSKYDTGNKNWTNIVYQHLDYRSNNNNNENIINNNISSVVPVRCDDEITTNTYNKNNNNNNNNNNISFICSPEQAAMQNALWCNIYIGRHNMEPFWTFIRYYLPNAIHFIDIGANKGLVSARWIHLWQSQLNITSTSYVNNYIKPYFQKQNYSLLRVCGVTNMCNDPDIQFLPVQHLSSDDQSTTAMTTTSIHTINTEQSFQVHSFEPSRQLYEMHQQFIESDKASTQLKSLWKWHNIAIADTVGDVYFEDGWGEGSKIKLDGAKNKEQKPNTKSATLDSIVDTIFGFGSKSNNNKEENNVIIDVIKIDAETFDAQIVTGAVELLRDKRIRFISWEGPERYPVHFPEWFGGTVYNLYELVTSLERYAGMVCYYPGQNYKMIKITGCWDDNMVKSTCTKNCPYKECKPDISNTACVQPKLAPDLALAMESRALIYGPF